MKKKKVIVILGTTASGKTDIAILLAKKFGGEIISADSRQIYKGMDIGTGKELYKYKKVRVHLLDIVSPNSRFNVAEYQKKAYEDIEDILLRQKLPILCGGTGLYIDAVVKGYVFEMQNDEFRMKNVRTKLSTLSLDVLLRRLKKNDPKTYGNIDKKNRRRVQMALEIYTLTGKTKSEQIGARKPSYEFLKIGITHSKDILKKRIEKRLRERLKSGLIQEVKRLHEAGVSWKRLDEFGLEYRWASKYIRGMISRQEMEEKLFYDIVHFAKRQMTWFRRDQEILWVKDTNETMKLVKRFLRT